MQNVTLKNCPEGLLLCGQRDKNYLAEQGRHCVGEDSQVLFDSCEEIVFDGDGSEFVFAGRRHGFLVRNCKNILLKNFTVDYSDCIQLCGRIVGGGENYVEILPQTPYRAEALQDVREYLEFYPDRPKPYERGNFLYNCGKICSILSVKERGEVIRAEFSEKIRKPKIGNRAALCFTMYGHNALRFENCKDVRVENVTVYTAPGMALYAENSEDLSFDGFRLQLKPDSGRLMTATADGMHFKNCRGDLTVRNCLIENCHDDAFNCAGMYMEVLEKEGGSLSVRSPLGMWATYEPQAGDTLEICGKADLKAKGTAIVLCAERQTDCVRLRTDNAEQIALHDLLGNVTAAPRILFEKNVVRNKRNRGVLLQSRNCIIRNNVFDTVLHGAVSVLVEVNHFYESIAPADVQIVNNKFTNCNMEGEADVAAVAYLPGFALGEAGVIRNIRVEGNTMIGSYRSAVCLSSVRGARICGNLIRHCCRRPVQKKYGAAISLENCSEVEISNNRFEKLKDTAEIQIRNCSEINC